MADNSKQKTEDGQPFGIWASKKILHSIGQAVKWIFGLGVLGLVILLVLSILNLYTTGTLQSATQYILISLSNTPIAPIVNLFYSTAVRPQTLITGTSWESQVQKDKSNEQLGVRIKKLETTAGAYTSGDTTFPPTITGETEGSSLSDELKVTPSCQLKDYEGEVEVIPTEVTLFKTNPISSVQCIFKDSLETSAEITTKKATLKLVYPFKTRAFMKVYTIKKENRKLTANPFENIQEPYLQSDNTIKSITSAGPLNIGIGLRQSQPLSEDTVYFFGITLVNNEWLGNLEMLNGLTLYLPSELELDTTSTNCEFIYSGLTQERFKIYELTQTALDSINVECSKLLDILTEDDCINKYKNKRTFFCNLKVLNAEPKTTYIGSIKAEADYTYSTKKSIGINIIKVKEPTPKEETL